jgi:AcrR family transcriptional regulator
MGVQMLIRRELSAKMLNKRTSLLEAGRYLFMENGMQNTSVDAIVKRADVAKGTFYLYFHDKDALLNEIVYDINRSVLLKAYRKANALETGDYTDRFIYMIDDIINHFAEKPRELALIRKNFSWPLLKERITSVGEDSELNEVLNSLAKGLCIEEIDLDEAKNVIYATVEMCFSLCYSCIINQQPADMQTMKPTLYLIIRKILG